MKQVKELKVQAWSRGTVVYVGIPEDDVAVDEGHIDSQQA